MNRIFLGWDQPLVRLAADHLAAEWPDLNFQDVLLVTAAGQAGRRIVAALADEVGRRGVALVPPRLVTPGTLPDCLIAPPSLPCAGRLARQVAWASAMRDNPEATSRVFPRAADDGARRAAAAVLDRWSQELAAGGHTFDVLAARLDDGELLGLPDTAQDRWAAAAALHRAYLADLRTARLSDAQDRRLAALRDDAVAAPGPVVMVAVVDPPQLLRDMLARTAGRVDVLVYAPPSMADTFDADGAVRTAAWANRAIDLSGAQLRTVDKPGDQATEAFAAIARGGRIRSDAVTIAVTDEQLVPYLETAAARLDGVTVRYGGGQPLPQTRPSRLLSLVGDFLESRRFAPFAALVRHTDVQRYIGARVKATGEKWHDWHSALDRQANGFLPDRLGDVHRTADGWGPPPERGHDHRPDLAWLYTEMAGLVGDLAAPVAQPLAAWAPPAIAVLRRTYGDTSFDLNDAADHSVYRACLCLSEAFGELATAADEQPVSATEAIHIALGLSATDRVPPPTTGDEIEMLGWLELLADDAERIVVVGFNDGLVPESVGGDAFLTDSLRRGLGLACDEDRAARDGYVLSAILASRPPGRVTLIGGRVTPAGDPLRPSRLLFGCDAPTAARRVLASVAEPGPPPPLAWSAAPGAASAFPVGLPMPIAPAAVPSMRVTAFRDYLRSPAGFYLQHVLKLETVPAKVPRELDASQVGDLLHESLRRFAESPAKGSTDGDACGQQMVAELDGLLAERYAGGLTAAAQFQAEMLRRRLAKLGRWQAEWAGQGWEIQRAEWQPDPGSASASIEVDGQPMLLRGRIDRVDRNAESGAWALFDYKTGRHRTPEEAHFSGGEWQDLQLPLYRHLSRGLVPEGAALQLGYIGVGAVLECIGGHRAEWDAAALASADAAAERVVRGVRASQFGDLGEPPVDGIFAHIFGQGLIGVDGADTEAE